MEQPLEFVIATRDFDVHLLPEDSRQVGTQRFAEEVGAYYTRQFEPLGGDAVVGVGRDEIMVSWVPDGASANPVDYAVSLLQSGRQEQAIPLLWLLLTARPDDGTVLYNLGVAESELGEMDAAIRHLTRATEADPTNANAYAALGVAQQKVGDGEAAVRSLEQAVAVEPDNGHARLNLGAILGAAGRSQEAEHHLREALRLMPDSQRAVYGLAHTLEQGGGEPRLAEADGLYRQAVALAPQSNIAELAERALSELAQRSFHAGTGVPVRMDAALYCLEGLRTFSKMTEAEVKAVAFEIGMLGARGLDVNNSAAQYTLRSLPGKFSGLHLMCLMYVGFQQIAPDQDIGFDLASEYALAQQMFSEEKQP